MLFEWHQDTLTPLNSCTSVEEVLTYLKSNPKVNFHLYGYVFNTIFRLYKSGKCVYIQFYVLYDLLCPRRVTYYFTFSTKLSAEEICRTEELRTLSHNVNKNVRFLKVEDAVTILKVLTYFEISTNSILCQNLLQMISKQVNRLGISQIMFLYYIIPECARSPLVDALKIAIPVVFETHVRSQLDIDDIPTLAGAVCFSFDQESVSDETRG